MCRANPFSTKFVRPGAVPYRLLPPRDLAFLLNRFNEVGRTSQIIGPHGSGKSTLLADLVRRWEMQDERVVTIVLHDGQRRLPVRLHESLRDDRPTLIAVDGYEQLSARERGRLQRFCRRNKIGLVVTSHRSSGLPDLVRCAPSLALVEQLVHDLLDGKDHPIDAKKIRLSFDRHQGNIREVLFEMYDLFEANG